MKHQSKQVGESATSEKGSPYPATKGGDSSSYHRIDRHPLISDYSRARSDELSDKSKELETQYEAHVPADKPFVMRLDGCSFKSFTRCLKKPFDPRLTQALVETSKDLVFHFKPSIGFCQSDEISLVFPAVVHNSLDEEKGLNHMYNGRVQKISSVAAGFASTRFQYHLNQMEWTPKEASKMTKHEGFFDCRIFSVPDDSAAFDSLMWRHKYDCRRNAINMIARSLMPHKQMMSHNVFSLFDTVSKRYLLKDDEASSSSSSQDPSIAAKKLFEVYGANNILGTFVKREVVEMESTFSGQTIKCMRTKIHARSFDWPFDHAGVSRELSCKLIMSKYWTDLENLITTELKAIFTDKHGYSNIGAAGNTTAGGGEEEEGKADEKEAKSVE